MQQLTSSQTSPEVPINENFETLGASAIFGKKQPTTAGLVWGYYGGLYNGNTVADGTVTLTDASTNYIVVLRSTGVVSTSTSSTNSLNTLYAKLYMVTTASGLVSAVVDQRQDVNGFLLSGAGTGGSGGTELKGLTFTSDTSSTADSDPGNGKFKWNNATEASATVLFFDNQTADGVSLTTFYASLGSSGFIYMQQQDDATKWQLWKWTATPVNGTGYYKFTAVNQASSGAIGTGKLVDCDFSGLGGGTGTVTSVAASGGVEVSGGGPLTTSGTVQAAKKINAQTGTTYAIVATDRFKHLTFSNAASIAATIAQAGTTGFEDGYGAYVENIGVGALTVTPTTSTINGAATLVLASGMAAMLFSDGTNYRAILIDRAGFVVNAQTGTSYTVLSGDRGKLVTTTNAAAIAETLPQATGAFGAGWFYFSQNRGAGSKTVTPGTSTIDGAATLVLTTGQGALIVSDGTNYFTFRGLGSGGGGGLTNFTDAVSTASPNGTTAAASLTATGAGSNIDAVLAPKGTGAVLAQVPDAASTAGNKRGSNAVDWQTVRASATSVASGQYAAIGGGNDNKASGTYSYVGGGLTNSATGQYAACLGYNGTASQIASAVLGGESGTASGSHATVVGGSSGTASGQYASTIGGLNNSADADYSISMGRGGRANGVQNSINFGADAPAAGYTRSFVPLTLVTTTATATEMTSDASGTGSAANRVRVPGLTCAIVKGRVIARKAGSSTQMKIWDFDAIVDTSGGGGTAQIINGPVTPTVLYANAGASSWTIAVTANNSTDSLVVTATGQASTTIHWHAWIDSIVVP